MEIQLPLSKKLESNEIVGIFHILKLLRINLTIVY